MTTQSYSELEARECPVKTAELQDVAAALALAAAAAAAAAAAEEEEENDDDDEEEEELPSFCDMNLTSEITSVGDVERGRS